jgi:protein SCO1/2
MRFGRNCFLLFALAAAFVGGPACFSAPSATTNSIKTFEARGVVREIKSDQRSIIIRHQEIPGYMAAMTMPFNITNAQDLAGIAKGDEITFHLHVTDEQSWIDSIRKVGLGSSTNPVAVTTNLAPRSASAHPLRDFTFTNQLGQPVRLNDFKGQALAITFFFTRCPVPDFCPRLSKNFEEASHKLAAMPDAPTNFHFLSVSFDTAFDTPQILKAYAERYHYDSNHWSFITGPQDKITELAKFSDVTFDPDGGLFNHSFRTLIIDAQNRLQMSFPIGGNLSDAIVSEMLKAARAK